MAQHYPNSTIIQPSEHDVPEEISIYEFLELVNCFSSIVKVFLGANLTANYLRKTKPTFGYLGEFEISKNAQFRFKGNGNEYLTAIMHLGFKLWFNSFLKAVSALIQDLPGLIKLECKKQHKSTILSLIPAAYWCELAEIGDANDALF